MKNTSFYAALTFLFVGILSIATAQKHNLVLQGKITAAPTNTAQLIEFNYRTNPLIDTIHLNEDGTFKLTTHIDNTAFYKVQFDPKQYILLVLHPNDNVYFECTAPHYQLLTHIKNAPELTLMMQYRIMEAAFQTKMDSLNTLFQQKRTAGTLTVAENQSLQQQYMALENQLAQNTRTMVLSNKDKLATMVIVEQLNFDNYSDVFIEADKALYEKYPDNIFVAEQHKRVLQSMRTAISQPAPEIELPDPNGTIRKLSDLKGKIVLVDFWASWCGPCRRENPNVVRLYGIYKDKGFEVFSVSLDGNKADWQKAIEKDGLIWENHVSDLARWNSVAAKTYGVSGIPYTVLLDREGKIIAKGLRGEQLEQKLKQLLN